MKKMKKYICLLMIAIAVYNLFVETYIVFSGGLAAQYTLPFISDITMLIVAVMGLNLGNETERIKMLTGISSLQTFLCLLAIVISNSVWITFQTVDIDEWLSITASVILLIYYICEAINTKRQKDKESKL